MYRRPPHAPGNLYHLTMRGVRQLPIFGDDRDRSQLRSLVIGACNKHGAETHAFCWMTNHLHLLIRVDETPIGRVVQAFSSQYARQYNQRYGLTGHLFERRYWCGLVDSNPYVMVVAAYIHLNPVTADMVRDPADYRWSSARIYASGKPDWIVTEFVLEVFDPEPERARRALIRFTRERAWECRIQDPLDLLLAEACRVFELMPEDITGPRRSPHLIIARKWFIERARPSASFAEIARRLHRSRAAISKLAKQSELQVDKCL